VGPVTWKKSKSDNRQNSSTISSELPEHVMP
jgi:hypothetical protein